MKQLKFLKTISIEGKPIWYKDCIYDVVNNDNVAQSRNMYKLFCEDLQLRGIDTILENRFYKVIEIPDVPSQKTNIIKPTKKTTKKKKQIKK